MSKQFTERCRWILGAGHRCRCWGTQKVNEIWYCDTHAAKAKREAAAKA